MRDLVHGDQQLADDDQQLANLAYITDQFHRLHGNAPSEDASSIGRPPKGLVFGLGTREPVCPDGLRCPVEAPMKALALAVLAFVAAVPGRAAATDCPGWTVTVLNDETKELKTWCPDDESFSFLVPGASKDVACMVSAVTTSKANATARERRIACGNPTLGVQKHAFWFPAVNKGYAASFVLSDVKADVNFTVSLSRGGDATAR